MTISLILVGSLTCLVFISLALQLQSRHEVRKLRNTVDLMKANQLAVIAESQRLSKRLIAESDELNGVLIQLHDRRNSTPA